MATNPSPTTQRVTWQRTADANFPLAARVGEQRWVLRVNDFPDEPLYTLFVDGRKVMDVEDWPSGWTRPPIDAAGGAGRAGPISPPQ